eukprot:g13218.t1
MVGFRYSRWLDACARKAVEKIQEMVECLRMERRLSEHFEDTARTLETFARRSAERGGRPSMEEVTKYQRNDTGATCPVRRVRLRAEANIGGFALPLSRHAGPNGQVHAFEPFRVLHQVLTANCAINGLLSCFTYHYALGNKAEKRLRPMPGLAAVGNPSKSFVVDAVKSDGTRRASDGYILQKYVEMPHLLDPSLLQEAEQAELAWQPTTSSAAAPRVVREGTPPAMFKYNLRHWVLINWTGSDPPVWFYEHGYIELCTTPFTESLEVGSHIANLSQQGKPTLSAPCKRMWSTSTLSRIVAAACPLRTGTEDGVEDGPKCAKGWQGDAKRRLLAQFYPDEQLLCGPNHGMSGDTWDPIGAFQRLPQQ